MPRKLLEYLLFIACLLTSITIKAQTYPVQEFTQLIAPYTPFTPDYYTGTVAKLKVTLINTDMREPQLEVYLRMKITSSMFSMVTSPYAFMPRIELQAGVPTQLSLDDLADYFKIQNLQITGNRNQYLQTKQLPDNFYEFNFEVYDSRTNRLLSNNKMGMAMAMIAAGDPPLLNMPAKASSIVQSNIPNILFSWTPRHMNSVAAAYNTQYNISLVEIQDKTQAPQNAFLYSPVLFTETVNSPSFIYTAAQPPLIAGMRYAWRVQAVAKQGIDDANIFKNNGYSEIFWFDYTADCHPVQSFGAIYQEGHMTVTWIDNGSLDYTVEYRKKGSSRWYTGSIVNGACPIYNLQLGKTYDYRVGSRCVMNDPWVYTDAKEFLMPDNESNNPNCGVMADVSIKNKMPLQVLDPNLPVFVGDFPVFVTKASGAGGTFSGEGYVGIPYLKNAQVAVTFTNVAINTDHQLISGFFETKYDLKNNNMLVDVDKALTGGKDQGDIRTGEQLAAFKTDYSINPSMKAIPIAQDGGKDPITGSDGTTTFTKGENGKYEFYLNGDKTKVVDVDTIPTTIMDKDSTVYRVDTDGNVTKVDSTGNSISNLAVSAQDSIYSFIINKDTKIKYKSGSDVYLCQADKRISISVLKKDSTGFKNPVVDWQIQNKNITDSITFCDINKVKSITVKAKFQTSTLYLKLKIYKPPIVDFFVDNYDGSFGFDNYIGQYNPHRDDVGKEDHQIMMNGKDKIYVPNISMLPNQQGVIAKMKFVNVNELQKDSLVKNVKIYSANAMVQINNMDTLIIKKIN